MNIARQGRAPLPGNARTRLTLPPERFGETLIKAFPAVLLRKTARKS